jgi:hypothetical protein
MANLSGKSAVKRKGRKTFSVDFEKAVARVQQMIDPASLVTHNEILIDRFGNKRQFDVVVRGRFGGAPMLGLIECKNHKVKIGPTVIEAFAKIFE